ncbi:VWA domain-containing protein [Arthrobacter alpinus]|uniref:DUF7927 domain-containing protein n=1 Tax=Arthrobacter alpinus TaxID=656366 RepID=UPI0009433B46|nr:VWA domain-containing protein [Arthrobacter alpinus]
MAGVVAAVAVAGTMAASALPAIASPDSSSVVSAAASVSPNPALPQKCGLNLALVFDLSNSMSDSDVSTVKSASAEAVAALSGTGTTMGVYSFATFAKQELTATSLASEQGAASVVSSINALTRPGDANTWHGGTNWQQGLKIVPEDTYDGVIFFTDGVPTFYGANPLNQSGNGTNGTGGTGNDSAGNPAESLNAAIPEANVLKDSGTRIIGVGVRGADADRLSQITGPVPDSDFYTTNYDQLAATLKDIATAGCTGTLNINKSVEAHDSTATTPGEGWVFDAFADGSETKTLTTNVNGQAGMSLNFPAQEPVTVTIKERQQDGYTVVQKSGYNAVCTRDGQPLEVVNTGDAGNVGFAITATAGSITSCTVTNKAPVKSWTMEKSSDTDGTVNPGETITYSVTASNTGEQAVDGISFRDDLTAVLEHATYVTGSATLAIGGAAGTAVSDPLAGILSAGPLTLAKGQSALLTYQVKVNGDAFNATLINAVTGTGEVPPSACVQELPCTTTDIVPPQPTVTPEPTETPTVTPEPAETPSPSVIPSAPGTPKALVVPVTPAAPSTSIAPASAGDDLAYTGSSAALPAVLGGLLLIGGLLLLALRRTRRAH